MAEAAQPRMTVDEFLRWAEGREGRYELVDGRIVAIAPERIEHARMKFRAARVLDRAIERAALPCEVFVDGPAVRIDAATSYQPDVIVHCGPTLPGDGREVGEPLLLLEVVSPSSASVDRGRKLVDYFRLPSLRHYLVLDPDRRVVVHHERTDSDIRTRILKGGRLRLDPPGMEVVVEELLERATDAQHS